MTAQRSVGFSTVFVVGGMLLAMACRSGGPESPVQPSPVSTISGSTTSPVALVPPAPFAGGRIQPAVTFPPQNEPFAFRQSLENYYRDTIGAPLGQSYVDLVGGGVWISEYIRYRVNLCSHAVAVANVFTRVDTQGTVDPPVCGNPPAGVVTFPPRNEPADFRAQLEAKYRDQLRRAPTPTYVNLEGDIVWMQQYFLYRLNECDHNQATARTLTNIQTGQTQAFCTATSINAVINGPTGAVNSNRDITFSGLNSSSNKGPIVSYQWNCAVGANVPSCSSSSATPTFRYPKNAALGTTVTYTVRLTVRDSEGNIDSTDFTLRITQAY